MRWRRILIIGLSLSLVGCMGGDNQDLTDFINETKRRPKGQIEPMPTFTPYQAFTYSAARLRNPFEQIVEEQKNIIVGSSDNVKPDFNRPKELLENYNFASLSMVGTIEKDKTLWALVDDGEGQIHMVKNGNYLGKNHGRIVASSNTKIDIIEIVTDGLDGWVERPRSLQLKEKE
ncbi:type 4a pilus biogenesis lipoprotein PilP [Aurantivibrio plasticivorans]